jgi:two-component system, OmpR family, sensor histidine kinase KdpD
MAGTARPGGAEWLARLRLAPLYGGAALLLALLTAALYGLVGHNDPADAALTYLLVVLLASTVESLWLGLWTALLAALLLNYFFLPPIGTLSVTNPANWFALAAFLVTAIVTSQLVARARLGRRAAEARERLTRALLTLSDAVASSLAHVGTMASEALARDLAAACARSMEASACVIDVRRPVSARAAVGEESRLSAEAVAAGQVAPPSAAERFAEIGERDATWVVPLGPGGDVEGLLWAAVPAGGTSDSATAVEATARLATLAIERAWLAREAATAEAARQSEEFKSILLSGVSHELRTPLATIRLSATALQRPEVWRDAEARAELLDSLDQEAARLNARVGSLLAMSRVESGSLVLDLAEVDSAEVVAAALRHLGLTAERSRLRIALQEGLRPVRADVALMGVALANLVENALKYGPAAGVVDIVAEAAPGGRSVRLSVADRGPGLADGERERVFQRFYRDPAARRGRAPGSGLGLSIARALTEAHGGTVRAEGREGGGSVFVLELPVAQPSADDRPPPAMPAGARGRT